MIDFHKYMPIIIISVLAASVGLIVQIQHSRINDLKKQLSNSVINNKAYEQELSDNKKQNRLFVLTAAQLKYSNDSLTQAMDSVRQLYKVKDKNLKSISYVKQTIEKNDTVLMRDTIFREDTKIDTTLSDKWYTMNIQATYPNRIIVSPKFISSRYVVASYKKETIKPPNKWWIIRLFQRKQKVVIIDINEESPYITTDKQRYIEIIK